MSFAQSVYEKLTNEEDARVCAEIGEDACREAPSSFGLLLASYLLTKLGDALASPKTTLAWLTGAVGAPAFVLAFLVPIRESGSLIPQLFIGGVVRRLPIRKWVWVGGSLGQFGAIAGIGVCALFLEGAAAGWSILALIAVFSLARGFCSVAAKDVLGKTIPKNKRGQLMGWSAAGAGLLTVGIGGALMLPAAQQDATPLSLLVVGAALLWLLAAGVYAQVPEYAGETGGGGTAVAAVKRAGAVLGDKPFRRFVMTRALLMCSALAAPFYVALAQERIGVQTYLLGAFVAAAGLAGLVSGPVWGRFADVSSKRVMIAAALVTAGFGLLTAAVDRLLPALVSSLWFLPLAYFGLAVAHSGVRVGRKTYVVNLGTGNQRTDYVAVSNSVIGVLLLLAGGVGALAPLISNTGVIGLLSLMGLAGAALGTSLPEAEAQS